ncbi:hypothetical protein MMB17_20725 [Methylobacterium organophilum]|uniref:hypothetical protein n=1 Tax=Methylobacterium organophilum TaxID=410 RepID=UPI001F141EAD|nr:hypothetical protein [Methylobacterium organophilum]UMY17044.1 hypothetical protein MMB17_20725 [Methylobacterium organophilum]
MRRVPVAVLLLLSVSAAAARDHGCSDRAQKGKVAQASSHYSKSYLDEHLAVRGNGDCLVAKPADRLTRGYTTNTGSYVLPHYSTNPGGDPPGASQGGFMPGMASGGLRNEGNPFVGTLGTRR